MTQYNPHQVAAGALIKADNCVISRENIVEDRRGYLSYLMLVDNITQLLVYQNKVIAHNGSTLSYDNSGTPANYSGSYSAISGQKMRGLEAFSNLYATTSQGVQVFTDTSGTQARFAGSPRCLDPETSLNASSSGFLSANNQCAYRALIQRTDVNSNVIYGYPSTRVSINNANISVTGNTTNTSNQLTSLSSTTGIIVGQSISGTGIPANTIVSSIVGSTVTMSQNATATATGVSVTFSSSRNVDLKIHLPSEATTSDVVQIYRSVQVSVSVSSTDDELALVYQYTPSSTDISNGYITFTDSITDDLRGASLYTSPSQEGITQANARPPLCSDITLYKSDYVIYANTSTKQRLFLTLVGVSSLSGKTITLGGVTYNFASTENTATGTVGVTSSNIASVNIDITARSLVKVINQYASNTSVYAYYLSGPTDLPGQILIEERGVGGAAYTVQASDTAISGMFFPPPPVSPSTNSKSTSTNQVQKNAIYFSKAKQPEAVPLLNYLLAGSASKNILRVAPLRNSLVIIKEEGVYLMTGDQPQNFTVIPLDLTVFCKSADSVAVLANQVFMLSNQGVVSISETGVRVVSREIENLLKPLIGFSSIGTLASGAAYESERMYFLSVPSASTDSSQNQIYAYNYITRAWVHWTFGFNAAIVEPGADKLYFSKPSSAIVYKERKDFTDSDYADPEGSITITAIDTVRNIVTFTYSAATPQLGWVISQGLIQLAISDLTLSGGNSCVATVASVVPSTLVTGIATLYPSVGMEIVWDAWTGPQGQAVGILKQVSEFAILTDNISGNNTATILVPTFKSNFDDAVEEVTILPSGAGWGTAWGTIPWGGAGDSYGYRTYVPRNKQRCRILNAGVKHKSALEKLSIAGCAYRFEMIGERIGR